MARWMVDTAIVLSAATLLGGLYYLSKERAVTQRTEIRVAEDVRRFQEELALRAASGLATTRNPRGWPVTVDPAWFGDNPPRNDLLSGDRPWVTVAPPEHAELLHPPVRAAVDPTSPSFWYNPYQGVVRALVPMLVSEQSTIDLYNRVNNVRIVSLFEILKPTIPAGPDEPLTPTQPAAADASAMPADSPLDAESLDPTRPAPDTTASHPADAPKP